MKFVLSNVTHGQTVINEQFNYVVFFYYSMFYGILQYVHKNLSVIILFLLIINFFIKVWR